MCWFARLKYKVGGGAWERDYHVQKLKMASIARLILANSAKVRESVWSEMNGVHTKTAADWLDSKLGGPAGCSHRKIVH